MKRRRAFTLVEIMIVVLIIGLLLSIAVPQWMNARTRSQTNSCLGNLRRIDNSKEQWAMETHQPQGAAVTQADLWPDYIKGSAFPVCPASGTYVLNIVGTNALCSQHGSAP